jgi:hypothetical protein
MPRRCSYSGHQCGGYCVPFFDAIKVKRRREERKQNIWPLY